MKTMNSKMPAVVILLVIGLAAFSSCGGGEISGASSSRATEGITGTPLDRARAYVQRRAEYAMHVASAKREGLDRDPDLKIPEARFKQMAGLDVEIPVTTYDQLNRVYTELDRLVLPTYEEAIGAAGEGTTKLQILSEMIAFARTKGIEASYQMRHAKLKATLELQEAEASFGPDDARTRAARRKLALVHAVCAARGGPGVYTEYEWKAATSLLDAEEGAGGREWAILAMEVANSFFPFARMQARGKRADLHDETSLGRRVVELALRVEGVYAKHMEEASSSERDQLRSEYLTLMKIIFPLVTEHCMAGVQSLCAERERLLSLYTALGEDAVEEDKALYDRIIHAASRDLVFGSR